MTIYKAIPLNVETYMGTLHTYRRQPNLVKLAAEEAARNAARVYSESLRPVAATATNAWGTSWGTSWGDTWGF